jgi:hypothetical protein
VKAERRVGSSAVEERQVEPAQALEVGDQVDGDDLRTHGGELEDDT